jgi:hypothetical protein
VQEHRTALGQAAGGVAQSDEDFEVGAQVAGERVPGLRSASVRSRRFVGGIGVPSGWRGGAATASIRSLPPADSSIASQDRAARPASSCARRGSSRVAEMRRSVFPGIAQFTAMQRCAKASSCSRLELRAGFNAPSENQESPAARKRTAAASRSGGSSDASCQG